MTMNSHATVLAVDDFPEWRSKMRDMLSTHPEWAIVAEAGDGEEAIQKAKEYQPDIILLDIGVPNLNGIEAARRIRQVSPHSRILFITQETDQEVREEALNIKGTRYLLKSNVASELVPAIVSALADRFVTQS